MSNKKVLDIGNCDHDHGLIKKLVEDCGASITRATTEQDALLKLSTDNYDLILVNRMLDADNSYGLEIIKRFQTLKSAAHIPKMLISNFPEAQSDAVAAGALEGFGKQYLQTPETKAKITAALLSKNL